jgi:hypothetical protein
MYSKLDVAKNGASQREVGFSSGSQTPLRMGAWRDSPNLRVETVLTTQDREDLAAEIRDCQTSAWLEWTFAWRVSKEN